MSGGHWATAADDVLRDLFAGATRMPSEQEIYDAYPFGQRRYHPYKVWLERVKVWRKLTEKRHAFEGTPMEFAAPEAPR